MNPLTIDELCDEVCRYLDIIDITNLYIYLNKPLKVKHSVKLLNNYINAKKYSDRFLCDKCKSQKLTSSHMYICNWCEKNICTECLRHCDRIDCLISLCIDCRNKYKCKKCYFSFCKNSITFIKGECYCKSCHYTKFGQFE